MDNDPIKVQLIAPLTFNDDLNSHILTNKILNSQVRG